MYTFQTFFILSRIVINKINSIQYAHNYYFVVIKPKNLALNIIRKPLNSSILKDILNVKINFEVYIVSSLYKR